MAKQIKNDKDFLIIECGVFDWVLQLVVICVSKLVFFGHKIFKTSKSNCAI